MKRLRCAIRLVVIAAVVCPIAYALFLRMVPTDWARRRLEVQLSTATGHRVRIGKLGLAVPAGVWITGLEITKTGESGRPWLEVASARIDLCLIDLLKRQAQPRWLDVDGLVLRLERHADGSCPIADLLHHGPTPDRADTAIESHAAFEQRKREIAYHVTNARIETIDQHSGTRMEITGISAHGAWSHEHIEIQELSGLLNGGTVRVAARLDRDGASPRFEIRCRARDVALDRGMSPLGYLIPIIPQALDPLASRSRAMLSLDVHGSGSTRVEIERSLTGHGKVSIDPIAVSDSPVFSRLAEAAGIDRSGKVGSLEGSYVIINRLVHTDDLRLELGGAPIVFKGWSNFDGLIEYQLGGQARSLTDRIPGRYRGLLDEFSVHLDRLSTLKVTGTLASPQVEINGAPLSKESSGAPNRRERLRELGQRLRDELVR